jgi:uncharacterized membrane protein HdeD (DUF308 family)
METMPYKRSRNMINHWWLILLSGVLLIGLGIWVIVLPAQSYLTLSLTFSFIILAAGVFEIIFSISNLGSLKWWGWTFTGGVADLIIGVYLLSYPGITMVILPFVVGLWMLFRGIIAIGHAIEIRAYGFHDWIWLLFAGIMIILLAEMIFATPVLGIINVIVWTGLAFIFGGLFRIYLSIKLRELKND